VIVRSREGAAQGWTIRISRHSRVSAHGDNHEIAAPKLGARTCLTEGGDGAVDQTRVATAKGFGTEPQAIKGAGTLGLEQNVRSLGQLDEVRTARVTCEVKDDSSLACVAGRPKQAPLRGGATPRKRAALPSWVAARRLHFDHIRTKISEDLPGEEARLVRHIQDPHALEHRDLSF
jgi:hypothetical protein